jgi:hypothetical protein
MIPPRAVQGANTPAEAAVQPPRRPACWPPRRRAARQPRRSAARARKAAVVSCSHHSAGCRSSVSVRSFARPAPAMATQLSVRAVAPLKAAAFDPLRLSRRASRPAAPRRATGACRRAAGGRSAVHAMAWPARRACIAAPCAVQPCSAGAPRAVARLARAALTHAAAVARRSRQGGPRLARRGGGRRAEVRPLRSLPAARAFHPQDSCAATRRGIPRKPAPRHAPRHAQRSAAAHPRCLCALSVLPRRPFSTTLGATAGHVSSERC